MVSIAKNSLSTRLLYFKSEILIWNLFKGALWRGFSSFQAAKMSTSALRRSAITPPIATTTEFTVENKNGYSILRLNKAPVNSLSLEFLTAFGIELDKLEDNKSINGVILTSVSLPFAFNFDNLWGKKVSN